MQKVTFQLITVFLLFHCSLLTEQAIYQLDTIRETLDMRLSLFHRSDYLDYLADDDIETTVEDLNYDNIRFTDDHSQIDFTAKYYLNDNLTSKFDLININDEPEFYYWGNTSRLSQYD